MVVHIATAKLKSTAKPEQIEALTKFARSLPEKIPEIKSLYAGSSFNDPAKNNGFTFTLVLTFDKKEDIDTFLKHEAHHELHHDYVVPVVQEALMIDFDNE